MKVERKFLLEWINIGKPHSISTLSTAAHDLKVATDYLEVSEIKIAKPVTLCPYT